MYLLLAWGLAEWSAGWRYRCVVLGGLCMVILAALIVCARTQVSYWRNGEMLWAHTVACTSGNYVAHNTLGFALFDKGHADEAIAHFQKSLEIKPDYAAAHDNLGNALLHKGRVDEAILHFQTALQITPDNEKAHNNLGNALVQKGRMDEAIVHYQTALQIKPDYAVACNNLGNALLQKGSMGEAIIQYQKSLEIKPDSQEVLNNLAWLLAASPQASLRNGNKAVELAKLANQLTSNGNPNFLSTLATAYAETGRFSEAVQTAQRALQLAEAQSNTALADDIRSQIKLYQAGLPFHLR
jgi:Flp pilus assembly protein TadD